MIKKTLLIFLAILIILSIGVLYNKYIISTNNFLIMPSNLNEKEIFLQQKGHYFYVINEEKKEIIEVKRNKDICTIYDYKKNNLGTLAFFISQSLSHSLKDIRNIQYILFISTTGEVKAKETGGSVKKIEWVDDNRLKVNLVNGKEVYLYDPFNSSIFEKLKERINRSF
ncbi:MAG: hypothetical protein ACOCZ5_01330 [bacterium]